jgi:hypothetical protein
MAHAGWTGCVALSFFSGDAKAAETLSENPDGSDMPAQMRTLMAIFSLLAPTRVRVEPTGKDDLVSKQRTSCPSV